MGFLSDIAARYVSKFGVWLWKWSFSSNRFEWGWTNYSPCFNSEKEYFEETYKADPHVYDSMFTYIRVKPSFYLTDN